MTQDRRTGLLDRPEANRDARLFLVATEDRYAQEHYFDALRDNNILDVRRLKFEVLPTRDGHSSPKGVLRRLRERLDELKPMDQGWISIDRDRWPKDLLENVANEAAQLGVQIAMSLPCFEAWLLLHLSDEEPGESSEDCERRLREVLSGYNKSRIPRGCWTTEAVGLARERARRRDLRPEDRWPSTSGSRLYRLLDALEEAGALRSGRAALAPRPLQE